MPDSGPSMETLYENGLILYHESVLAEDERLQTCKEDQDCHPLSNYCCRFTNDDIGYNKQFCLGPKSPKFSGEYLDLENNIVYNWACPTETSFDHTEYDFNDFRNA